MTEGRKSSESLKHVSLLNHNREEVGRMKVFKACCRLSIILCQMMKVKNKGAVVVLILTSLVITTFVLLGDFTFRNNRNHYLYDLWPLLFCFTTSLSGWLTDAFLAMLFWLIKTNTKTP